MELDFDMMLVHVGEFGLYQKILFFFQAPFCIFVTFVLFGQIFMILTPRVVWCTSNNSFNLDTCNNGLTDAQRANLTSPFGNPCVRFNVGPQNISNHIARLNNGYCNPVNQSERSNCIWLNSSCTADSRNVAQRNVRQSIYNNNNENSRYGPREWPPTVPTTGQLSKSWNGYYENNKNNKYDPTTTTTTNSPMSSVTTVANTNVPPVTVTPTAGQVTAGSRSPSPPIPQFFVSMAPSSWLNIMNYSSQVRPPTQPCGRSFSHNTTEFNFVTIPMEANYWCDTLPGLSLEWKLTITQAVFFVGAIIGGFIIGYIADNYGRIPALVTANLVGCIGGALSVSSTNFWLFCFFRFICGFAFDNCFTMMYILVLEYVGPSYRTLVANLSIAIFYTLGTLLLPGLFAWITNWRYFGLVISLPMLLALVAIFIVPESARWLLSKGRTKEATNILRSFAKVNRKQVDEEIFVQFEESAKKMYEEMSTEQETSLLDALKRPRIFKNFVLLVIIWSLIALIYDGHSRNVQNLGSNVLVMFAIASSTEFPADLLLVFTLDIVGRRWLAFGALLLSALSSLVSAIEPIAMNTTVLLVFAMISRFWVNVAFNIGLQYAAELLPTAVRAQGVNIIHIMGYVASIISPFIASLGRTNVSISLTILGFCALVAGVLCLFLPETLGEDLPNSLEDGETFGKNQSFWNCPMCSKPKEPEEMPIHTQQPDPGVSLRNSMRAPLRGETFRSSIISRSSRDRVSRLPVNFNPDLGAGTEGVKLRRVYTR